MTTSRPVDDDAFREWMAPIVGEIRDFAAAVRNLGDLVGRDPSATSPAMTEIAEGAGYRSRTLWKDPIHDSHTFGGLTVIAVSDYAHGYADLFTGPQVPFYSHLAIARPALESAVVATWLNEPGVGTIERMKRGLVELIYSAAEVNKLDLSADGPKHLADWQGVASGFGWTGDYSRERPIIDRTKRPRTSDGIRDLLGRDAASRIGDSLFSRLSAVSHVTWWGVQWALNTSDAVIDPSTGLGKVEVGTDSKYVCGMASFIVRALREAAQARVTLMGWMDAAWEETRDRAMRLELRLLELALA